MLNEDKIRLMTEISMLEKNKGKDLATVHRYFRGDYISLHMLRYFLGFTFCWCLGLLLVIVCQADDLISVLNLTDLTDYFLRYAVWYAGGLFVYMLITFLVCFRRFRRASRSLKRYLGDLKSLERRYEFQDRIKKPGKEVKRS